MSDLEEHRQFDDRARARVISELKAVAWGDVESTTDALERALELALQATIDDFLRWENEGLRRGLDDEFGLSPDDVAQLSPEWKAAYVARLLRTIALMYGVETEFGAAGGTRGSPADIIRNLSCAMMETIMRRPRTGDTS